MSNAVDRAMIGGDDLSIENSDLLQKLSKGTDRDPDKYMVVGLSIREANMAAEWIRRQAEENERLMSRCEDWERSASHMALEYDELSNAHAVIRTLLADPHGCPFCDSGKLRSPNKGHDPGCGFRMANELLHPANGG